LLVIPEGNPRFSLHETIMHTIDRFRDARTKSGRRNLIARKKIRPNAAGSRKVGGYARRIVRQQHRHTTCPRV